MIPSLISRYPYGKPLIYPNWHVIAKRIFRTCLMLKIIDGNSVLFRVHNPILLDSCSTVLKQLLVIIHGAAGRRCNFLRYLQCNYKSRYADTQKFFGDSYLAMPYSRFAHQSILLVLHLAEHKYHRLYAYPWIFLSICKICWMSHSNKNSTKLSIYACGFL